MPTENFREPLSRRYNNNSLWFGSNPGQPAGALSQGINSAFEGYRVRFQNSAT